MLNADKLAISKLVEAKNNYKYLIGCLGGVLRALVLILPKMRGYVKTCKDKSEYNNENNKLMSLRTDVGKLLGKYKTIWTKIKDLKKMKWYVLPVFDER